MASISDSQGFEGLGYLLSLACEISGRFTKHTDVDWCTFAWQAFEQQSKSRIEKEAVKASDHLNYETLVSKERV